MAIAHAKLSASGSKIWLNCPGSVAAQEHYPDSDSPASREGTVAHELASQCLSGGFDPKEFLGVAIAKESDGIDEIVVDDEMVEYIRDYMAYVHNVIKIHREDLGEEPLVLIEEKVDFSEWTLPGQFGTGDTIIASSRRVDVIDLKYGRRIVVDVVDNSQAKLYGLGSYHDLAWLYPDIEIVVNHIYQPRANNIDDETIDIKTLLKWGVEYVRPAALATKDPKAKRIPGGDQCQWCKHRANCKELAAVSLETANMMVRSPINDFEDMTVTDTLEELLDKVQLPATERDGDFIAEILPRLNLLALWCTAVKAQVDDVKSQGVGLLMRGGEVPGSKLVEGKSTRRFTDEKKAERWVEYEVGEIGFLPRSMKSLAQVEKLLNKGQKKEFRAYWEKPPGKLTMVPETDKRDAVDVEAYQEKMNGEQHDPSSEFEDLS